MRRWLFKSEPDVFGWDDLVAKGDKGEEWNGVRSFQARNIMREMKVGDRGFFYHSNEGLEIVGVVEIAREYYPDPGDEAGRFGMVDVRPVVPAATPVTLKQMKADPVLADMALIRQSRLSVCPVTDTQWRHICRLAGIDA